MRFLVTVLGWACFSSVGFAQGCPQTSPSFTCSSGSVSCDSCSGNWSCPNGTACPLPPPYYGSNCQMICTGSGWYCYIPSSPIVIDTKQEGFHLTDYRHGVKFHFYPDKPPLQMSWTDPAFSNGWLALDRNGNGIIDDATELFGDLTPQPESDHPNGFGALAVFDSSAQGGNENGKIDPGDAVFSRLKV